MGIRNWLAGRRQPNRPTVAVGLSADRVRLYQPGKPGHFVEAAVGHAGEWGSALAGLLQPLQLQGARVQVGCSRQACIRCCRWKNPVCRMRSCQGPCPGR